ncbi:hypothetical protein [Roseomonas xinghualingensis]|uniref:hypothetical protein n=1 Tax=Roseomonas xinghualingensis TaxID=2986475 RepID=UPI0021F190D9|nr:hypothetical protein [Roseomonas sp. SXEYE001]MCV4210099.1 hypothetical protein [Roseomonas sp. SXEYE001]
MITRQPNEVERLSREGEEDRRHYERIANAGADLMSRLHAMVAAGALKAFPEMEAMEIALADRDGEP